MNISLLYLKGPIKDPRYNIGMYVNHGAESKLISDWVCDMIYHVR